MRDQVTEGLLVILIIPSGKNADSEVRVHEKALVALLVDVLVLPDDLFVDFELGPLLEVEDLVAGKDISASVVSILEIWSCLRNIDNK